MNSQQISEPLVQQVEQVQQPEVIPEQSLNISNIEFYYNGKILFAIKAENGADEIYLKRVNNPDQQKSIYDPVRMDSETFATEASRIDKDINFKTGSVAIYSPWVYSKLNKNNCSKLKNTGNRKIKKWFFIKSDMAKICAADIENLKKQHNKILKAWVNEFKKVDKKIKAKEAEQNSIQSELKKFKKIAGNERILSANNIRSFNDEKNKLIKTLNNITEFVVKSDANSKSKTLRSVIDLKFSKMITEFDKYKANIKKHEELAKENDTKSEELKVKHTNRSNDIEIMRQENIRLQVLRANIEKQIRLYTTQTAGKKRKTKPRSAPKKKKT